MFKKEELKAMKTAFWADFRSHMSQHRSANGRRMNWLSYPSEIDFIYIRVDADGKGARFSFDIQAKDAGVRAIIWEQMYELKAVLESEMGTDGQWIEDCSSQYVPQFNRILWERTDLNFFHPEDKQEIFSFLEDRLVRFDAFYQEFKDILTNLAG